MFPLLSRVLHCGMGEGVSNVCLLRPETGGPEDSGLWLSGLWTSVILAVFFLAVLNILGLKTATASNDVATSPVSAHATHTITMSCQDATQPTPEP